MQPPVFCSVSGACLTFFGVWTKRNSWGRARVCLRRCYAPSCDLVPSWHQSPLNWGPLSHNRSRGYTHRSHSTPDCRPPTAHLAHWYYVTVVCVCVWVRDCLSPADTICSVLCEPFHVLFFFFFFLQPGYLRFLSVFSIYPSGCSVLRLS